METSKTKSPSLIEALSRPNGARFYRCALQVNPFAYYGRHVILQPFIRHSEGNFSLLPKLLLKLGWR